MLTACCYFLLCGVASAGGLKLQVPLRCGPTLDCSIQNFYDHDPGPGFRDYACGHLGYDGHDGTDIRLPNLAVMRSGVPVLAAAAGTVRGIRDGMPDVSFRDGGVASIRGREAGNAVALRHGGDWETQYSHLRMGSVRVRPGDMVNAGDILGFVGLSGKTEFPHLHFEVRHRGIPVDPFVGLRRDKDCGIGVDPLWDGGALRIFDYRPTGLLQAGFSTTAPDLSVVEAGDAAGSLRANAAALLFWVEVFGVHKDDRETLWITGPDDRVLAKRTSTISGNKARWLSYAGRKLRDGSWPSGIYRGAYRLERDTTHGKETILDLSRAIFVD